MLIDSLAHEVEASMYVYMYVSMCMHMCMWTDLIEDLLAIQGMFPRECTELSHVYHLYSIVPKIKYIYNDAVFHIHTLSIVVLDSKN